MIKPRYIVTNDNETIDKLIAMNYEVYFESCGYYYFKEKPNEEFDTEIEENISYTDNIEINGLLWEV